jgi:NAD-dependent deacetylase
MQKIVVLTGAGISAESGIKTFRDEDGLWEGHDVMEVATPEGWKKNPALVLHFYNQRRRQLHEVHPNKAHLLLAKLEQYYKVHIITQNVDDLHERAGSTKVLHLHGELKKARSVANDSLIVNWETDIKLGDLADDGKQLRPHIVWFGEAVPKLDEASALVQQADLCIIIGTSMQVYPAAGLIDFVARQVPIYFIDPRPSITSSAQIHVIAKKATDGMEQLFQTIINTQH